MITLTGCTTLRPIDANHPDLSQSIASGELKIRDHVIVETTDWLRSAPSTAFQKTNDASPLY
jgi:hypothetical protein